VKRLISPLDSMLQVVPYLKSKDSWILGDIEEVRQRLEENQTALQTMLGSKYIAAVQQEVDMWDKKLAHVSEVLDEWLQCQKAWMYLEPIFAAADIQRQLPREAKMFAEVDRFWKEVMRKAHQNSNVMHCINSQPNLRDLFVKNNQELDRVQKHLEEYLETKRVAFPRFYFLSNEELVAILSKTRDPQSVQPHLHKCFDNIARLEFVDDPSGAPPTEVCAMVSNEGEVVPLARSVHTTGATELWLSEVETVMRLSVKQAIKRALIDCPPDGADRFEWLVRHPAQAVLTVDQLAWTAGVTKALYEVQTGADRRALDAHLALCRSQISKAVTLMGSATALTPLQRQTLSALIILDVHGRDVLERLIDVECRSTADFEWTKQLRTCWEREESGLTSHRGSRAASRRVPRLNSKL